MNKKLNANEKEVKEIIEVIDEGILEDISGGHFCGLGCDCKCRPKMK